MCEGRRLLFWNCSFCVIDLVKDLAYDKSIRYSPQVLYRKGIWVNGMNKFRQFMVGRYGTDELSFALLVANLIFWGIEIVTGWWLFWLLSLACLALVLWRTLSRQIYKRRKENQVFLQYWNPIRRSASQWLFRVRDRSHRYVRCKKCRERLRLPRGKGKIEVTCPKCRERFITKT